MYLQALVIVCWL